MCPHVLVGWFLLGERELWWSEVQPRERGSALRADSNRCDRSPPQTLGTSGVRTPGLWPGGSQGAGAASPTVSWGWSPAGPGGGLGLEAGRERERQRPRSPHGGAAGRRHNRSLRCRDGPRGDPRAGMDDPPLLPRRFLGTKV